MPVINDLVGDQRLHRMASTLSENGYNVLVTGRLLPDSLPLDARNYSCRRVKMWFTRGKAFYLEYNLRLLLFLLRQRVDIIHANDLDTLLASFLAARIKRIPLVYDSHEYFTEVPELIDRPRTRKIWLLLEQWIFPRLRYVYTVNESIANIYSQKYGVKVRTIRNLPVSKPKPLPKSDSQSDQPSTFILLYQGALNIGRGIELMIKSMQYLPGCELWIIGKGDVEQELRQLSRRQPYPQRIVFQGFVPPDKLYTLTAQASVGLSLEEDRGENYRLASPNKIYDYIQARIPVIVSDLPEMRKIIEKFHVGEILPASQYHPKGLAAKVQQLYTDPVTYNRYVKATYIASGMLNWEIEQQKLLDIYQELETSSSRSFA